MDLPRWVEDGAVEVFVDALPLRLPDEVQKAVEECWTRETAVSPHFFRGPVLSVQRVEERTGGSRIYAAVTDYAHYLYGRNLPEGDPYQVRVLFAAACLCTCDHCLIAGVMSAQTSRPGWIQAVGGSADAGDIVGGRFLPVVSARREAREEVGLDVAEAACRVRGYTQDGAGRVAIAVEMRVPDTADEVARAFREHARHPLADHELEDVVPVPLGPGGLRVLNSRPGRVVRYLKTLVTVL